MATTGLALLRERVTVLKVDRGSGSESSWSSILTSITGSAPREGLLGEGENPGDRAVLA